MKTWQNTDKSNWPNRGEWDKDPDKAHWVDEKTGLDCLIVRGPSGALCGYVGVPEDHQFYGVDYDRVYDTKDIDVHGGLTFSDSCQESKDESKHICHSKNGCANEKVWWLGFDCAHSGDTCPAYETIWVDDFYKSFSYVKREVTYLAQQLVGTMK